MAQFVASGMRAYPAVRLPTAAMHVSLHVNGLSSDAAAEQRLGGCDGENREPFDVCQLKE